MNKAGGFYYGQEEEQDRNTRLCIGQRGKGIITGNTKVVRKRGGTKRI